MTALRGELLQRQVVRLQGLHLLAQPVGIDAEKRAYRLEGEHLAHTAGVKPLASIDKFGTLRAGWTVLGSHVAAQRIFEDREEELKFAARRMPASYPLVVLDR
jgi:hypothetical protein